MAKDHKHFTRSSQEELETWYKQKTGRTPNSESDLRKLWYEEYFRLNPRARKEAELIVQHAEKEGGLLLQYCRLKFPEYWGDLPGQQDPRKYAEILGVPSAELDDMLTEMMLKVLPKLYASAEYRSHPDQVDVQVRLPDVYI